MTSEKKQGFINRLGAMIEAKSPVEAVADDPALMAELLLLVRMSLVDREASAEEAASFKAICVRALGLDGGDIGEIVHFLDEFGYETSNEQAAAMLADLPDARKRAIMDHLASMARADGHVTEGEKALFHNTARRLGLEP